MKTIVLQSFRTTDVPRWLKRCMDSVRGWAARQGWDYECLDDRFFELAPAWVRERCARNIYALTDICRLQWMKNQLASVYDRVIWADADMLIFAPDKLAITNHQRHAFAHELFLRLDGDGGVTPIEGINNAMMVFQRDDPVLDAYLEACLRRLRELPEGPVPRTALGPSLLVELAKEQPLQILHGVGLFTPEIMRQIGAGGGPLPREYLRRVPGPLGAANLCHFQRNGTAPQHRIHFDSAYAQAVDRLLATAGEIVNN